MSYVLLFVWCFLSASIIPFSSEPYYVALIALDSKLALALLIATLGNTAGGITTFFIGVKSGEVLIPKFSESKQKRFERAQIIVAKYGSLALVLSWVPFFGDAIVFAGGVFRLPFWGACFWMTVGKAARYYILGLITLGFL